MQSSFGDKSLAGQEATSCRVQKVLETLLRNGNISGEIVVFGSFSNGFKTGGSDLDVVLVTKQKNQSDAVTTLNKVANLAPKYNFTNITKIFQANVPILKFTDASDGMEIDFCINNLLGIRNSLLLQTYCRLDPRIPKLGKIIKAWAKSHEIVGTADGCLNSYAYMLLVIYYLQVGCSPPVAVNLQALHEGKSHDVIDYKWGAVDGDVWNTSFLDDVGIVAPTQNKQTADSLLNGFFAFYTQPPELGGFDWKNDAVCMRLTPCAHTPKTSLVCFIQSAVTDPEQWCVEDPFDLKHNLAGKCTASGKKRIVDEMINALRHLSVSNFDAVAKPPPKSAFFYLKCRISAAVTPQAMLEEFEDFNLNKLFFPKTNDAKASRFQQAFLEFTTNESRRRAHTKNETYVADCQLQMHYTSQSALNDTLSTTQYSMYDMLSYKQQKHRLEAGVKRPNPNATAFYPGMPYGQQQQHMDPRAWEAYTAEEQYRRDASLFRNASLSKMDPRLAAAMLDRQRIHEQVAHDNRRAQAAQMKRVQELEMAGVHGHGQLFEQQQREREYMDSMMQRSQQRRVAPTDEVMARFLERSKAPMSDREARETRDVWYNTEQHRQGNLMDWYQHRPGHPMQSSSNTSPVWSPISDPMLPPVKSSPSQTADPGLKYPSLKQQRKDEERRPIAPLSPTVSQPQNPPSSFYNTSTFKIDLTVIDSTLWNEVPVYCEPKKEDQIETAIIPMNLVDPLRNFYGQFCNDEYAQWKKQMAASVH